MEKKFIQVLKILEACPTEIPNVSARSVRKRQTFKRIKTNMNSWKCDNLRYGPLFEACFRSFCSFDMQGDLVPRQ